MASMHQIEHVVTSSQGLTFSVLKQLFLWPLREGGTQTYWGGLGEAGLFLVVAQLYGHVLPIRVSLCESLDDVFCPPHTVF